jgi:hypothetical protein
MDDKTGKGLYILFLVGLAVLSASKSMALAVIFGCLAVAFFASN